MTSKEFIIWLKGFAKAANSYNVTPAQWDAVIEELHNVRDENDQDEINYEPWYNPYQPDFRTPYHTDFQNTNGTTATALQFPKGTTVNYTNKNNS
jgi:hypothetical protein